ncbi:MAG TPA: acetyl-CoA C-acyltransferase [Alphaproteobacteria bacterium]|nr:acetyl-CoA C-acyltransferase [Alphaproteobacteria bacterium]
MNGNDRPIWLVSGLRTPFVRVDGPLAHRDTLGLSVPVVQAMAATAKGPIDFAVWGAVVLNLSYNNLAREVWLEAGLDPHIPTFTTIMQCSTSMVAAFEAAGMLNQHGRALALAGGVESMSRVQIGLTPGLSFWIRRLVEARNFSQRLTRLGELQLRDIRLKIPEVKNRATGKSMGEHCEDMAKTWNIGRREQDEVALRSHQRAVAGQERSFFTDLIVPVDGVSQDAFPRRDTSIERLTALKPVFDRTSGKGTLTAGNSSPLTDGAAGIWVANDEGLARLPVSLPRARLVDFEIAAVDLYREGLLMAPVSAIPRLLSRHRLTFDDIVLWEIHEAFAAQLLCHIKGLDDKSFVREKAGVEHTFGTLPRDRINPNGGSVALGHPFAATGARILSQAVKELAELPKGSRAIVSICADGGLGTVALLES